MIFKHCPKCSSENILFKKNLGCVECKACQFVYFHNTAAAVAGIISCADKVLFTIRNQDPAKGTWDLPGGFVSYNETAVTALCREIDEEIGVKIKEEQCKYITTAANVYSYKGVQYHILDIFYEIHLHQMPNISMDKKEIRNVLWVSKNQIQLENIGLSSIRKVIDDYIF